MILFIQWQELHYKCLNMEMKVDWIMNEPENLKGGGSGTACMKLKKRCDDDKKWKMNWITRRFDDDDDV